MEATAQERKPLTDKQLAHMARMREARDAKRATTSEATPRKDTSEMEATSVPQSANTRPQREWSREFKQPVMADGSNPLPVKAGFVLRNIANTPTGRAAEKAKGWEPVFPGEGIVLDEMLCEVDREHGYLTFRGDVVAAMTAEMNEGLKNYERSKCIRDDEDVRKQSGGAAEKRLDAAIARADSG